jgi:hypothetical protein
MSSWGWTAPEEQPVRRVREDVRDGLAVIACSAAMSLLVALALLVFMTIAG